MEITNKNIGLYAKVNNSNGEARPIYFSVFVDYDRLCSALNICTQKQIGKGVRT
ncbi:hypothetical protein I33_3817 [Bacillus subtilis subsp. subtilis str. RO-NN-1]|nr:hypothetical protein I33_3817 [Bacillus subtilis subsp. subtilis str. RO-NN-1]